MDQIRVLVVDDSAFMRHVISSHLQVDRSIRVVGTARDGLDALEKIRKLRPDVVTLDLEMPRLDGLATLSRVMTECPVPVIMLSSPTIEGADSTIRALAQGAVDFVAKPSGTVSLDLHKVDDLVAKVKQASVARVRGKSELPIEFGSAKHDLESADHPLAKGQKAVVICCSTGGPAALHQLIPSLPRSLGAAVLIVQDMPPEFTRCLANHLNGISELAVREAEPEDLLAPGLALLAPGDFHTVVKAGGRVVLSRELPVNGARPSADITMKSIASVYGPAATAVVLTGTGNDGTQGAFSVKAAGGWVIAEDASTCVVWDTPRCVADAGLADRIVPLHEMAEEILWTTGSREPAPA